MCVYHLHVPAAQLLCILLFLGAVDKQVMQLSAHLVRLKHAGLPQVNELQTEPILGANDKIQAVRCTISSKLLPQVMLSSAA